MIKFIWISALTTGLFCAGFAAVIDAVTDHLGMIQVICLAGISGTLGSLFAHYVVGRRDDG
jgi:hypothetical protein